jgi:hypothetical protein
MKTAALFSGKKESPVSRKLVSKAQVLSDNVGIALADVDSICLESTGDCTITVKESLCLNH